MTPVVFDSSFLISIADRPTNWREDITQIVGGFAPIKLDCVMDELKALATKTGSRSKSAAVAIEIASEFKAAPCREGDVDSEIASYARTNGAVVASMDGELLRSLKASRVRCVTLRGGRVALF